MLTDTNYNICTRSSAVNTNKRSNIYTRVLTKPTSQRSNLGSISLMIVQGITGHYRLISRSSAAEGGGNVRASSRRVPT